MGWAGILGKLWNVGGQVGAKAWGRILAMIGDRSLWLITIFFLTFTNFLTNLVASVTQASGSRLILAFQSLGVTLGGSIGQMVNGLRIVTLSVPGQVGLVDWVAGILTFLLGASTIYWWYRGNSWFVDFMESTDPTIVHRSYMTAILLLSVLAFHDASQFYELINITEVVGEQVASNVGGSNAVNQTINATQSGSTEAGRGLVDLFLDMSFLE